MADDLLVGLPTEARAERRRSTSAVAQLRWTPFACVLGWLATRSSLAIHSSEGWAHQDLNLEPADYEPAALTVELWAHGEV